MNTVLRRLVVLATGAALLGAALLAAAAATDRAQFCRTCHEMAPYNDAWEAGPHADVQCVECHVEPGMRARLAHKFVALKEVRAHFFGTVEFPLATPPDVPSSRCTRCHADVPASLADGLDHALHAERGGCADCHHDTGHAVTVQALKDAGVYAVGVSPKRLSAPLASVDAGEANLPGHKPIACARCHDLKATGCAACHPVPTADHPDVAERACAACHAPRSWAFRHPTSGVCSDCHEAPKNDHPESRKCPQCHRARARTWAFTHPSADADCTSCHEAPGGKHPSGARCIGCHRDPGRSWSFRHPGVDEHGWRKIACAKCHPRSYDRVYCSCHGGRAPEDD